MDKEEEIFFQKKNDKKFFDEEMTKIFFPLEMEFDGFCKNLLQTKESFAFIGLRGNGLWVRIRHRKKPACCKSNPVENSRSKILNQRPVQGKGVCSASNQTAQQLQHAKLTN